MKYKIMPTYEEAKQIAKQGIAEGELELRCLRAKIAYSRRKKMLNQNH